MGRGRRRQNAQKGAAKAHQLIVSFLSFAVLTVNPPDQTQSNTTNDDATNSPDDFTNTMPSPRPTRRNQPTPTHISINANNNKSQSQSQSQRHSRSHI